MLPISKRPSAEKRFPTPALELPPESISFMESLLRESGPKPLALGTCLCQGCLCVCCFSAWKYLLPERSLACGLILFRSPLKHHGLREAFSDAPACFPLLPCFVFPHTCHHLRCILETDFVGLHGRNGLVLCIGAQMLRGMLTDADKDLFVNECTSELMKTGPN